MEFFPFFKNPGNGAQHLILIQYKNATTPGGGRIKTHTLTLTTPSPQEPNL
ncbi:MAG: hypothetical protein H6581_09650 [Bacteroidia bacterium]|nr:hypothetical protein [Bacteroidia bacterium]